MAVETEIRLQVPKEQFDELLSALQPRQTIGETFRIRYHGQRENADTYFDAGHQLRDRGWSLRTRERGNAFIVTLKRPMSPVTAGAVSREELETPRDGSFESIFAQIADSLAQAGIVVAVPQMLMRIAVRDGAFEALRLLGLSPLFTIRTTRHVWDAEGAEGLVAEVVLDDSSYETGPSEGSAPERECRMEIELADGALLPDLDRLGRMLIERFRLVPTEDSKFERGLIHYRSSHLRDKLEAKIQITDRGVFDSIPTAYQEVVAGIERDPTDFIANHRFEHSVSARSFHDVYYDTADQQLYQAGCYLRVRDDHSRKTVTFRRLSEEKLRGLVQQQEVIASSDTSFEKSWSEIAGWLRFYLRGTSPRQAANIADAERALATVGIRPVLEVRVVRDAWAVRRTRRSVVGGVEADVHVAKLKFDRIEFRKPGAPHAEAHEFEFEAVGVEDDGVAPRELRPDEFRTFLTSFTEACTMVVRSGTIEQRIHAKYFQGMRLLHLAHKTPPWEADGRLGYALMPLLREPASAPSPAQTSIWPHARFASALAALVAGTLALADGAETGIFAGAKLQAVGVVGQTLGFLALCGAWFYLARNTRATLSTGRRRVLVSLSLFATFAVSIPWFGRHTTADAAALLALAAFLVDRLSTNPQPAADTASEDQSARP